MKRCFGARRMGWSGDMARPRASYYASPLEGPGTELLRDSEWIQRIWIDVHALAGGAAQHSLRASLVTDGLAWPHAERVRCMRKLEAVLYRRAAHKLEI